MHDIEMLSNKVAKHSIAFILLIIAKYIEILESILGKKLLLKNKIIFHDLETFVRGPGIDERIEKIEEARLALAEGLKAVEELKFDAERNKAELAEAIAKLNQAQKLKEKTEGELEALRNVMNSDIQSFQRLAGIQNPLKEKLFGFFSGIVASIVATLLWIAGTKIISMF